MCTEWPLSGEAFPPFLSLHLYTSALFSSERMLAKYAIEWKNAIQFTREKGKSISFYMNVDNGMENSKAIVALAHSIYAMWIRFVSFDKERFKEKSQNRIDWNEMRP